MTWQQQVVQVAREHADRLVLGAVAELAEQVGFQVGIELDLPGPAHHLGQPLVGGAALVGQAEALGDHDLAWVQGARRFLADLQRGAEDAFVASAEDRQGAVRRGAFQRLIVFEVVAELGAFLFLAGDHAGGQGRFVLHEHAQLVEQRGVFGEALHEDVLGAFQHRLDVGEAFLGVDETRGLAFRDQGRVVEQCVGQRAEAGFQGDLALGAALLLIRQVEVFETGLGVGELDVAGQFGGQLALFLDAGEDRAAAFFQFAQVAQALFQHAQLGIVEAAGDLFAVTGDEGNGGAFVEQGDGSGDLLRLNAAGGQCGELFGDTGVDAVH